MKNPLSKFAPQLFGDYPAQFNNLIKRISIGPEQNQNQIKEEIWKAYEFGNRYHEGQKRLSGKPYFSHCLAVASTLASWRMDTTTIIAGLLHDTVEDTDATLDEIKQNFGKDLGNLVDGLTKISEISYSSRKEKQAGNFMKMLLSVAQDLRVIIVKFADRIHNMETIQYMPQIKRHRIAIETRDIYVPLAHRLGMSSVKSQLEDLVFRILNPIAYKDIEKKIKSSKKHREKLITKVIEPVEKELNSYNLKSKIYGRAKSKSSIYGKMLSRNKNFNEIYDIHAIRIIVDKIEDCYLALGIVHKIYLPIQNRFKDFIAAPKSNGYQSIHTTIIGKDRNRIEIQIRTKEMEETAEIGVAAHWMYQGKNSYDFDKNVSWLRELLEILQNESNNPKEFMNLLKIDLYNEEIFAFTPSGDLIQLPINSTPVDFAFQVHTQIGIHCMGAKVNHAVVPLNTKLKNGDTVEIITSNKHMPSYGWQKFIVTTKARNEVNRYLKKAQDNQSIKLGEELINKTLRRMKLAKRIDDVRNAYNKFGYSDKNSLLKAVGTGVITVSDIFQKINQKENVKNEFKMTNSVDSFPLNNRKSKGILINGIDNLLINYGKCCNPVPGDNLLGFVTRGRGVTVHRTECKSLPLLNHESDRLISVDWNLKSSNFFNVLIKVTGQDCKGWLKDISECIAKQNINITSVDIKVNNKIAEAQFIVQVKNNRQLNRLIRKVEKLEKIDQVERVGR